MQLTLFQCLRRRGTVSNTHGFARTFYRGNYRMVGVSNMDHDNILSAEMMDWMRPGFESGVYKPFPIKDDAVYGLDNVVDGYKRVLKDQTRDRIVIDPKA